MIQDPGFVRAVRGQEVPGAVGCGGLQAQQIGESHDAPAAIAAHHATAAVGVVELHGEIPFRPRVQDHHPVGGVFPAQLLDAGHGPVGGHVPPPAVQHHKIVPGAGEQID